MTDVFDELADIFAETLGEPVIYTPLSTGIPIGPGGQITAIWISRPHDQVLGNSMVGTDGKVTELGVRVADVASPAEGDQVQRVKDGTTMVISTPILPDGAGMIVCNLASI